MRVQNGAAWIAVLLLAGCQKAPPASLQGEFAIDSIGQVVSFAALADEGAAADSSTKLALRVKGRFQANVNRSTLHLTGVEILNTSGEQVRQILPKHPSWSIRLTPGGFESDRPLSGEEQWVSKCFASYWAGSKPKIGERTVSELDGENRVRYAAEDHNVTRRWLAREPDRADLPVMPNRETIPIVASVSGSLTYVCPSGFPARIEGEKRTLSSVGGRKVGESLLRISIRQSPAEVREPSFKATDRYAMAEASQADRNEAELQRKNLGGASLDRLLALATKPLSTQERNKVFLALRALFYLEPDKCAVAVDKAVGPAQCDLVAEALAAAGNSQSQVAFLEMLKATKGPEFQNRVSLLTPLTRLEPKVERALVEMAFGDRLSDADRYVTQLVVGGNVRRCLLANPNQAKRLSDRLASALRETSTEDDRLNLLYALGNAGNASLRPLQLGYLKSESAPIRHAAVHSLRHLLDEKTRGVLLDLAGSEPDSRVRKKIDEVLGQR